MSHPVNDMIADNAIDTVADLKDHEVTNQLSNEGMKKVGEFEKTLAHLYMGGANQVSEFARDILIDEVYEELSSRPGPHG
jgi:hypothetical protein